MDDTTQQPIAQQPVQPVNGATAQPQQQFAPQQQPVVGQQPYQPQAQPPQQPQQPLPQQQPVAQQPAAAQPQMRIDEAMLVELGLGSLSTQDKDDLLKQIYQTLEIRVGMKLAERMSDDQLKEFEQFINNKDDAGALRWLETNFPDYKQVVASELDSLKSELARDSDKIIAAASQAHASDAQPQPPVQQ